MAYTHTLKKGDDKEYLGVFYRFAGSNYWKYPGRLYDGDESTAPTSPDGNMLIEIDMSWLPEGMVLKKITYRYLYKRYNTQNMPIAGLEYSNSDTYTNSTCKDYMRLSLPNGNYNEKEWHTVTADLPEENLAAFMAAKHKLLLVGRNGSSTPYELDVTFTYEEANDSKIYIGEDKAKSVYVGTTKAKAVYIGNTKIL